MVEAVIFDLDGTVLDNEPDWEEAFATVMSKYQIHSKFKMENGWKHEPGIGLSANWRRVLSENGEYDPDGERKLVAETVARYQKLVGDLQVKLRDRVEDTVALAKERKWLTAVSTGSTWSVVERELEALGLIMAFDVTTTGEEVLLSKPDPEIYQLTMSKLGVDAKNCLVVEDAVAGVRAAKEIDIRTICLKSGYAPEKMLKAIGTDYIVSNFSDIKALFGTIE